MYINSNKFIYFIVFFNDSIHLIKTSVYKWIINVKDFYKQN